MNNQSLFLRIILLIFIIGISYACKYDEVVEPDTPALEPDACAEIAFSTDIKTIIETSCARSNCHVAGTGLPDFTKDSNIKAKASRIKARTGAKTMPPAGPLSQSAINKIACWVENGGSVDN
ncbi:hypothetical protein [Flexithrix dorotheae]|uniref:hypothetical protein n=1 Tax=Flexithrix dorotheae TaxID=70993 RepID=UPI00037E82AD|nr:hypothetical protein [Flexithrix dorotheae]